MSLRNETLLYRIFKRTSFGLPTFAEFRSKWCVLAESSGTHSACTIHQNFKTVIPNRNIPRLWLPRWWPFPHRLSSSPTVMFHDDCTLYAREGILMGLWLKYNHSNLIHMRDLVKFDQKQSTSYKILSFF